MYFCALLRGKLFDYFSGEIPRITSFERGFPGHLRRNSNDTEWKPDPFIMDERYLAVNVRNKGIVLRLTR